MKTVYVSTQKELDTAIKNGEEIIINNTTEWLSVYGNATIKSVYGNATIKSVYGNATIKSVSGNATIKYVSDNATIQYVYDNATIKYVSDNATIQYVSGNATIKYVSDNATIQYVYDNATIQDVYDNATIKSVYGNATIKYVYDNATIKVYSATVTIESCSMFAVIITIACVCKIKKKTKTVSVIKTKQATYKKADFLRIHAKNKINKTTIKLYKSVQKDNTDFYTGKIKYIGEVDCPDFKPDTKIECGNGLHLSPTPEMALSYNQGKVLECAVNIKDFVVFPYNITKVRCKKVTVLGEVK